MVCRGNNECQSALSTYVERRYINELHYYYYYYYYYCYYYYYYYYYQSPRKKIFLGVTYVRKYVCLFVCLFVCAHDYS